MRSCQLFAALLLLAGNDALPVGPADPVPQIRALAPHVWMLPEVPVDGREPDGNSVILAGPKGLVIIDSGRHAWHQEALLAFAASHGPIVALLNTHWHLDHTGGNRRLRERYPALKVYATDAVDEALQGFLAASAARAPAALADESLLASMRDDIRADLERIQDGRSLRPDVVVRDAQRIVLAGRRLTLHVARAATAADLWLIDESSGILILGDLVTLPAPFLDTACPDDWSAALAQVDGMSFDRAIPGHGPVLSHAQFNAYRHAFDAFLACSREDTSKQACAVAWRDGVAPLLADDGSRARSYAEYYVDLLRANRGQSAYCRDARG